MTFRVESLSMRAVGCSVNPLIFRATASFGSRSAREFQLQRRELVTRNTVFRLCVCQFAYIRKKINLFSAINRSDPKFN